ncbi:MAG: hypothetical protein MUF54_17445, partial [Polyangiaceae bacterium]|nr:hypothetical protein [Polyangiaceae bacterium]
ARPDFDSLLRGVLGIPRMPTSRSADRRRARSRLVKLRRAVGALCAGAAEPVNTPSVRAFGQQQRT